MRLCHNASLLALEIYSLLKSISSLRRKQFKTTYEIKASCSQYVKEQWLQANNPLAHIRTITFTMLIFFSLSLLHINYYLEICSEVKENYFSPFGCRNPF